jgi:hypothetical protein
MSTSAGTLLSFLRFRARRRGRAQLKSEPGIPRLVISSPLGPRPLVPEPLGPGLATLVRVPRHPATAAAAPARVLPGVVGGPSPQRVPPEPTTLARVLQPEHAEPARAVPDAALLTPAAAIETVLMQVRADPAPTTAVPGLAAPDQGAETTMLPSRRDAPKTTIHPQRAG